MVLGGCLLALALALGGDSGGLVVTPPPTPPATPPATAPTPAAVCTKASSEERF